MGCVLIDHFIVKGTKFRDSDPRSLRACVSRTELIGMDPRTRFVVQLEMHLACPVLHPHHVEKETHYWVSRSPRNPGM